MVSQIQKEIFNKSIIPIPENGEYSIFRKTELKWIGFYFILLFFFSFSSFAQSGSTNHRVIIFGNIADVTEPNAFLNKLETRLDTIKSSFTILLNGDIADINISDGGDPLSLTKKIMDLIQKNNSGNLIIQPGDRDWRNSKKGGLKKVLFIESEIESYIKVKSYKRIKWITPNGCPGPYIIEIDKSLIFIAVNSQWWNHPFDKPRSTHGICDLSTDDEIFEELEDAVNENRDKNVLIVGHHPFWSLGNYGGHFSIKSHMTPVPLIGSFRVAYRKKVGTVLDISNKNLEPFIEGLKNIFYFNKNLIYVSGHEYNHQIVSENGNYVINSGAIQQGRYVSKNPNALFTSKKAGWIELNYKKSGAVESVFVPIDMKYEGFISIPLFKSACSPDSLIKNINTPINFSYSPCIDEDPVPIKILNNYPRFEMAVAGEEYKVSQWKKLWWGKHYRTSWTIPVKVPFLNLDTTYNGLTAYKIGGGRQTTSLKFRSENRTVYVFRSVNKDPSKAFNYIYRPTLISKVIRDQTSTQQPYGAMAIAPLLDKINILHATPTLYLLPDDKKLGAFQNNYANLLGMLEENPGKKNKSGKLFGDADKIVKSNKLIRDLYKDHDNKVDINEFVRARIFDILVGDWSKHEDNWKWAKYITDSGNIYRPIPRDRDHVFSKQDGFFPYIADREWAIQNIENFDYKIKGLKSLMNQAGHMDRLITTEASRETWIEEAVFIKNSITEADIDNAVKNMPLEIYNISGITIAGKLKHRIKDLPRYAEDYYELLAKEIDVVGSNGEEFFEIDRANDGSVSVGMYNRAMNGQKGNKQLYFRKFYPKETKELRIYGLGGSDIFTITGEKSKKIKISVFGGSGDDVFKEFGKNKATKTLIYDKGKETVLELNEGAKKANYWNKNIYEYDRTRFKYNSYLPLAYIGYSTYNGISLVGSLRFTKQSYKKDDFAAIHKIGAGFSSEGNLRITYDGLLHHVINKWDILLKMSAADPEFHNIFYGLGNSTVKTDNLESSDYYTIKYSNYSISAGISREFWRDSKFNLIFGLERSDSKKLDYITILDEIDTPGAFEKLTFLPVKTDLDIDFRDEVGFPYNGIRWFFSYTNGINLNKINNSNSIFSYGYLESFIEYYISSLNNRKVTFGMRFGGAKGYGEIPFYKMPNLGGSNGLRGYTGQRFTGNSKIYINSELRWQLLHRYTALFPIKMGVKAFFDTGRVFYSDDIKKWHAGWGGGVFIVPFEEAFIISISIGFSEEESFYPIIGFGKSLN